MRPRPTTAARRLRAAACSALLAIGVTLALASPAAGHALLERTAPERGAALERAPAEVSFHFNEPVEAAFGALRVYDSAGERVDEGELLRPDSTSDAVATPLPADLAEGTYTAVYRVISADSHPVSGGIVFNLGEAGAPAASVAELIADGEPPAATTATYAVVRTLGYAAIALLVGLPVFALGAWAPGLASVAGGRGRWLAAAAAVGRRLRRLLAAAALLGGVSSVLAIGLQAALAAGSGPLRGFEPAAFEAALDTRFGTVTAIRGVVFALAGLVVLTPHGVRREGGLRRARLGADGTAPERPLAVPGLAALGIAGLCLIVSPALAGHPSTQEPKALLTGAATVHVAAIAVWIGGVAALVGLLPAGTRKLDPADRNRLLIAVLKRFSPLALAAVGALLLSGIVQSVVHLEAVADLIETGFGRAIAIKALLLAALIGIGAAHRRWLIPALERREEAAASAGRSGLLLRRALIGELVLMGAALLAAAALAASAPPAALAAGPQSGSLTFGPASVEYTAEPGEVGANELHVYLFDPETGAQYDRFEDFIVEVSLPERGIGPLEADAELTGPGHYTVPAAPLGVPGEWKVELSARLSAYEQASADFTVEVR